MREVMINDTMIRLGQLLKLAGLIDAGSDAKGLLEAESVWVNGEPESRRGRQCHPGDVISVGTDEVRLVN